jgi:hypothetical protein
MPIARWTIGNVKKLGFSCLQKSIYSFKKIYGDEFKLFVCYNSIDIEKIKNLERFGVNFIHQKDLLIKGRTTVWKYNPPRIDLNDIEIFIDNDIVFFNKIDEIKFLYNGRPIIAEDPFRYYGRYDCKIPIEFKINSGFFGIPAGFDFAGLLKKNCEHDDELDSGDEQGLTAFTLLSQNAVVIPINRLYVLLANDIHRHNHDEIFNLNSKYGVHFIGINRHNHEYYKRYISYFLI